MNRKKGIRTFLVGYCTFWGFSSAFAQDIEIAKKIIQSGNDKGALACIACHQQNGAGNSAAGFPQLAGMNADYFSKQIYDFQTLQRINPVMQPIAKGLSEAETKSLAAYFASLPSVPNPKMESANLTKNAQSKFDLGKLVAERGLWEKGIPACFACHGPAGRGVGANFPGISNQGKTYLIQQLQAWQKGNRKNDPNQLMLTVAKKLTAKEIEAVSEYLSSGLIEVRK